MQNKCPGCNRQIAEGADIVLCPVCDRSHHTACWEDNDNGCCVSGCYGHSGDEAPPAERKRIKEFSAHSAPNKRNLILVFLAVLIAGLVIYPRLTKTTEAVGISELSKAPSQYVGKLTISGKVGYTYAEEGVFIMVDGGGCCTIPILAPTTEGQKKFLEEETGLTLVSLYSGTLPAEGDEVTVTGTWNRVKDSYFMDFEQVTRNGKVILQRK